LVKRLPSFLPRGNTLDDHVWAQRHRLVLVLLALHLPGLLAFGFFTERSFQHVVHYLGPPLLCLILGHVTRRRRRLASFFTTAGLVYCSVALVALSGGKIEAHFHFFILIGFIALYQDWVPFACNIAFTVLSHGFGSTVRTDLIFDHHAAQASPWTWSAIHGVAVLAACAGVVLFWKNTEREQLRAVGLSRELVQAQLDQSTSKLLVNLARRNQSLQYRQLDLINRLEEAERDPDALAELFRLDHLATRIRRNSESLLVLAGEEPTRTWAQPVLLVDVVRASVAEIEDMDRVEFTINENVAVVGRAVSDLTHLLAEVIENAVAFSPPEVNVSVRSQPHLSAPGAWVLTVEDWGVGMRPADLAAANQILEDPQQVDLAATRQLGLHVVARLAQRYRIGVSLSATDGGGVTAAIVLPPSIFAEREPSPVLGSRHRPAMRTVPVGPVTNRLPGRAGTPGTSSTLRQAPARHPGGGAGSDGTVPAWWDAPSRQGTTGTQPVHHGADGAWPGPTGQRPADQRPTRTIGSAPLDAASAPHRADRQGAHQEQSHRADRFDPHQEQSHRTDRFGAHEDGTRRADRHGAGQQAEPFSFAARQHPPADAAPGGRLGAFDLAPGGATDQDHRVGGDGHGPGGVAHRDEHLGAGDQAATELRRADRPGLFDLAPNGTERGRHEGGAADGEPRFELSPAPGAQDGPLERRVPQSHLSPQLRRGSTLSRAARTASPVPDAIRAREALSRFQASRQATWTGAGDTGDEQDEPDARDGGYTR
jgi:signal transduction histidine kinase